MDWIKSLDEVKARYGMESDAELSVFLGFSRQMISHVRAGRSRLPLSAQLKIADKLGYAYTRDFVLSLLPGEMSGAVIDWEKRHVVSMTEKFEEKRLSALWREIDEACDFFGPDKLEELVSQYLAGKRQEGMKPRN
jgi:hypothetical protein